ncbi:MAG TPA: response regulator transcription factor [Bacteroidia bacterium]|nr:response regulator transcription factor [Bacteroidia bacterium]
MSSEQISVALVEDHAEFRNSLCEYINNNKTYHCIAFPNSQSVLSYIKESHQCPKIILMDINMPGKDGIECTQIIKNKYPQSLVMMCTNSEDDDKIFKALQAGASGYILKQDTSNDIFNALENLLQGGSPMSPLIARKVVESFSQIKKNENPVEILSERENHILEQLASGLRIKQVAEQNFVSVNTVKTHIRRIYNKLQVNTLMAAVNSIKK